MEVSRGWLDDVVEGIVFLIQGEEPVQESEMVVLLFERGEVS
jgi:hypothetical protein